MAASERPLTDWIKSSKAQEKRAGWDACKEGRNDRKLRDPLSRGFRWLQWTRIDPFSIVSSSAAPRTKNTRIDLAPWRSKLSTETKTALNTTRQQPLGSSIYWTSPWQRRRKRWKRGKKGFTQFDPHMLRKIIEIINIIIIFSNVHRHSNDEERRGWASEGTNVIFKKMKHAPHSFDINFHPIQEKRQIFMGKKVISLINS